MKLDSFVYLSHLFEKNGFCLYLVGGAVRDYLLNIENEDFDFVSDATPEQMKVFLTDYDDSFEKYGVIKILLNGKKVEITTLREEIYEQSFRKPSRINYVTSLEIDSKRRDFTINALYMDKDLKIYDFYEGIKDINSKIIKIIGDPQKRIEEDPLRILRCLRFKVSLGFNLDKKLDLVIKDNIHLLKEVSLVQVEKEIDKIRKISINALNELNLKYHLDRYIVIEKYPKREKNIIDLHCDTLTYLYKTKQDIIKSIGHIDIQKLLKSEYLLQTMAIFLNDSALKDRENLETYLDYFYTQLEEHKNYLMGVKSFADVNVCKSNNKIGMLLAIENGNLLNNDLEYLDYLYSRGIRMITLTWNDNNCLGSSCNDVDNGLTEFGRNVIKKMNELGMIIDLSHASDKTALEVLKISSEPVIFSHSNSRSVFDVKRNISDKIAINLKQNKGIIGINFYDKFISNDSSQIEGLVKHIKYFKDIGCIKNIAIGTDFDGIDETSMITDASKINLLIDALIKENFTKNEIDLIFHDNFLRVMKKVLNK